MIIYQNLNNFKANYGGRVTDENDRRLLNVIMK